MGNGVSYILQVIQAEKVYIQAEAEGVVFKSNFFFTLGEQAVQFRN